MSFTFELAIVSAETSIFEGRAKSITVRGTLGDLGVTPNHAPLITSLRPGTVKVINTDDVEEFYYVSGGMLEVQPHVTTILADTAERGIDIDEAAAIKAKKNAEKTMAGGVYDVNYLRAERELMQALAQLKTLDAIRRAR